MTVRVLYVEDSPVQAKLTSSSLSQRGFDIQSVPDAETAMLVLQESKFDAVLTDLQLPGLDGIALCRESKRLRPGTAVVLITSLAEPRNVLRGMEAGVDGFIVKGSCTGSVAARLSRAVEHCRLNHGLPAGEQRTVEFQGECFQLASPPAVVLDTLLTAFSGVYNLSEQYRQEVAERRRIETELQRAHDELELRVEARTRDLGDYAARLEESNRELQDFVHVASHDLQEPLRKIQAFSSRLQESAPDELNDQTRDYLNRMHDAAGRMRTLIEHLVQYSQVARRPHEFARVPLNDVLESVLADLEPRIEDSGARVRIDPLPTIEADAVQMRQLFLNLVGNAVKFRRPDVAPVITVSAGAGEMREPGSTESGGEQATVSCCRISVEDNGIGIREEYLERIFGMFERLHSRCEFEGTGLGLAICRKIVSRHGGTIEVTSTPGQGTRFCVCLPLRTSGGSVPSPARSRSGFQPAG